MILYPGLKKIEEMSEPELTQFYSRCMEDYHFFAQMVLGHVDMNDEHLDLCRFLEKDGKFKLVLMPRYTFKSCVVTQGMSLWYLLRDPNERILIYSDSATKAQGFLLGIKNHIEGKTERSRFREFFSGWETTPYTGKWNDNQIVVSVRTAASIEPSIDTGGIETSKIGMHYSRIFFDDIVSDLNVTTKAQMDKVHECYKKSLSLLKPGGSVILTGCLVSGSRVLMEDGSHKRIEEVKVGERVISYDNWKQRVEIVEAMIPQGLAKVYELKTDNGTIEATSNHPFMTSKNKFVRLEDLKVGDSIVLSGLVERNNNEMKLTEEDCWGLGFMFGDGWITHHPNNKGSMRWVTCFAKGIYEKTNQRMLNYFEDSFDTNPKLTDFGYYRTEVAKAGRHFETLGLIGKAKTKRISEYVYNLPLNLRHSFINGFIAADGHITAKYNQCRIEICNKDLIIDLKHLCEISGYKVSNIYHRRRISKPPHSREEFISDSYQISFRNEPKIFKDFRTERIKSIKYIGVKEVFDLTISNTHNFVSEGMVVHNTRWHFGDCYGRIIEENKEKKIFDILIKKAEDEDNLYFDNIGPDSLTREFLDRQKSEQGTYIFSCLYNQNPVSDEAALFKHDDFEFYGSLKESENPQRDGLYDNLYITGTLDPAGEGEDFTAGTVCGTDAKNRIYVLDLLNKRNCTPTEMIEWIFRMNRRYKFQKFGVETIFFRGMFERHLNERIREEVARDVNFKNFGVEKFLTRWRHGEGKKVRIEGLQPYHERGDILFPGTSVESLRGSFGDLAYQMMQTTRDHMPEPNDLLDALSWQIEIVQKGGIPEQAGPPVNSPAWLEEKWIEDHNRMQRRLPSKMRRVYEPSLR